MQTEHEGEAREEVAENQLAAEIDALSPPLNMDGTEHDRNADCWCNPEAHCPRCKVGWVHEQGIYGGLLRQCDTCEAYV